MCFSLAIGIQYNIMCFEEDMDLFGSITYRIHLLVTQALASVSSKTVNYDFFIALQVLCSLLPS